MKVLYSDLNGFESGKSLDSSFIVVLKADETSTEEVSFSPQLHKETIEFKIHQPKKGFPETYELTIPQLISFLRENGKKRKKKGKGLDEFGDMEAR